MLEPGTVASELDAAIEEFIRAQGGVPTNKGYRVPGTRGPYPAATCFCPNDVVAHGIPGAYEVAEGDLITLDMGVTYHGMHADACRTFAIGEVGETGRRLIATAQQALEAGMAQAVPGRRVGDISSAIQAVAEREGFSVVEELFGHGIGRTYHAAPVIPNRGSEGTGPELHVGMALAIEPIIAAGRGVLLHDRDGWTCRTADGSRSAEFEHTVVLTPDGLEILTTTGREARQEAVA